MKFNKNTKIGEILEKAPEKADLLIEAGMHCIGCPASQGETLEEACMIHGIDVNDIVDELNEEDEEEQFERKPKSFLSYKFLYIKFAKK